MTKTSGLCKVATIMTSLKLSVIRLGEGPHLIMLHGWGQSAEALRPLAELLKDYYTVHLVDLPGFGKSPQPKDTWGVCDYAERIVEYMDDNGISVAELFGHSFGGRVSIALTSRHPERVHRLILASSAGIKTPDSFRKRLKIKRLGFVRASVKMLDRSLKTDFYNKWFIPRYASEDYRCAGSMRPILVKIIQEDLSSDAAKIATPTLLLWGDDDRETPVAIGYRLKELMHNAMLVVFPDKGHHLFQGGGASLCAHHILYD